MLVCGTKPTPISTSRLALRLVMSSPSQRDAARVDLDQAEHRLEQRRLAGTVGADDADHLAGVGHEAAPVEDVHARQVAGDDVGRLDDRPAGRSRSRSCLLSPPRAAASSASTSAGAPGRPRPPAGRRRRGRCRGGPRGRRRSPPGPTSRVSAGPSATIRPSAITTTQSEMWRTTCMSCSTKSTVMPSSRRLWMWPSSDWVRAGFTPAIGSSSMIIVGSRHQGPRHLEQLALPAREAAGVVVLLLQQLEAVQQLLGASPRSRAPGCATAA